MKGFGFAGFVVTVHATAAAFGGFALAGVQARDKVGLRYQWEADRIFLLSNARVAKMEQR